jgi:GNAT superfamily N-acetyltransferase
MNFEIKTCTQFEWAENSIKMYSVPMTIDNYLAANIMSSLQFLPEQKHLMNTQAYCLQAENQRNIAWINVYFVSKNVIRIRGLYVLPEYRKQGYMSLLMNEVLKKYSNSAQKIISFSRKNSIGFHEKNGFKLEEKFEPRTMTLYNSQSKTYFHDPDGEIYLMSKYLP